MKKSIKIFMAWIFIACMPVVAQTDDDIISIALLRNSLYAKRVMKLIRSAKNSIRLCMSRCDYLPDSDDIATRLLKEIVIQAKRGLEVDVLLERGAGDSQGQVNNSAWQYLYENGIQVHAAPYEIRMNANFLIIDYYICIAGTTVWTSDSINKNSELEFIIESEEVAQMLLDRFNDIKEAGRRE